MTSRISGRDVMRLPRLDYKKCWWHCCLGLLEYSFLEYNILLWHLSSMERYQLNLALGQGQLLAMWVSHLCPNQLSLQLTLVSSSLWWQHEILWENHSAWALSTHRTTEIIRVCFKPLSLMLILSYNNRLPEHLIKFYCILWEKAKMLKQRDF